MRVASLVLVLVGCAEAEPELVLDTDARVVEELDGAGLYRLACSRCHGEDGRGGLGGPDLRDRADEMSADEIVEVILDGAGFMDPVNVSIEEAQAIADFVEQGILAR